MINYSIISSLQQDLHIVTAQIQKIVITRLETSNYMSRNQPLHVQKLAITRLETSHYMSRNQPLHVQRLAITYSETSHYTTRN